MRTQLHSCFMILLPYSPPLPCPLKELFPCDILLFNTFFLKLLYYLDLCRNTGMVRTGLPQGIITLHPLKPDNDILYGVVHMAHVELSGNVGRRNHNRKRLFASVYLGMKILAVQPFLIKLFFNVLGIISLCQVF